MSSFQSTCTRRLVATIVARFVAEDHSGTRRIIFYRVWKGDGQADRNYIPPGEQQTEMICDQDIYQQFCETLKAVFLEPHAI